MVSAVCVVPAAYAEVFPRVCGRVAEAVGGVVWEWGAGDEGALGEAYGVFEESGAGGEAGVF